MPIARVSANARAEIAQRTLDGLEMGADVALGVGVWALPEIARPGRRVRVVADFLNGFRNAPVVRTKSLEMH